MRITTVLVLVTVSIGSTSVLGCRVNTAIPRRPSISEKVVAEEGFGRAGYLPPPTPHELNEYRQYLMSHQDDSAARREFAMRLYQAKDVEAACLQLGMILKSAPDDFESRSLLALYLDESGQHLESERQWKHLIQAFNKQEKRSQLKESIAAEAYWKMHLIEHSRGNEKLSREYAIQAFKYAPEWMKRANGMTSNGQ